MSRTCMLTIGMPVGSRADVGGRWWDPASADGVGDKREVGHRWDAGETAGERNAAPALDRPLAAGRLRNGRARARSERTLQHGVVAGRDARGVAFGLARSHLAIADGEVVEHRSDNDRHPAAARLEANSALLQVA